jgi:hypothetical protein
LNQSGADAAARLAAINGHGEIAGLLAKTRTEEAERGRSGQAR